MHEEYPSAPWLLRGEAYQSIALIDRRRAAEFAPGGARIVSSPLGRTVGGLFIASYGGGSALRYHELIAVTGIVRRGPRVGAWIGRIYVDSEASMRAGREIWGLPKELAVFDWEETGGAVRIMVRQGAGLLCAMTAERSRIRIPLPIFLPAFGRRRDRLLAFSARGWTRVGIARAAWEIPSDSPLGTLGLSGERLTFAHDRLRCLVVPPHWRADGMGGKP